jgi:hypothetical protein
MQPLFTEEEVSEQLKVMVACLRTIWGQPSSRASAVIVAIAGGKLPSLWQGGRIHPAIEPISRMDRFDSSPRLISIGLLTMRPYSRHDQC